MIHYGVVSHREVGVCQGAAGAVEGIAVPVLAFLESENIYVIIYFIVSRVFGKNSYKKIFLLL